MQRKALKQLGKVTQWTSEKVFSGEKTQLSDDFTEFEKDVDVRRIGIERLHATSLPFFNQLTKAKPTADPFPPSGSGKEKILHTEALGLVMIDYGGDVRGTYGDGLGKYGRARCKLAMVQEEFSGRLSENYIAGMESSLEAVNDYKTFRKKLESRRLALDAAITRLQSSKKEKDIARMEAEVETARERFEEVEEETQARMVVIQEQEERQWAELTDLLEAELEYFSKCKEIMEDLRDSWPSGDVSAPASNRPRAKSNASARSLNKQATTRSFNRTNQLSEDEDAPTPNRSRSQSNASSTGKGTRRMLPSFGSLGKKGGLASMAGGGKRKTFTKDRGYEDDQRQALHSDEDDYEPPRSPASFSTTGRTRSQTTLSASRVSLASDTYAAPPPMRRTYTTPVRTDGRYLKALYDFAGAAEDELSLQTGDVIELKKEVSEDWYIGECNGHSGLFPAAYCEEYVPTPTTAVPPPRNLPPSFGQPSRAAQQQRTMPPPAQAPVPAPAPIPVPASPNDGYDGYGMTSESELEHGFSDNEHHTTASLALGGQEPAKTSRFPPPLPPSSGLSGVAGARKPPPPPPSRRSQSASDLLTASYLSPPQHAFRRKQAIGSGSSPEGSPFAGSEEDDESHGSHDGHDVFAGKRGGASGSGSLTPSSYGSNAGGGGGGALASGLSGMHLRQGSGAGAANGSVAMGSCASCGCEDFTQNVFKAKGVCSTCFHAHQAA